MMTDLKKHISILRGFAKFKEAKIKYLSQGANGAAYDIDGKYIAKFFKRTNDLDFNKIILDNNILKIIKNNVSFQLPVCDIISCCENSAFVVYRKVLGEEFNIDNLNAKQMNDFLKSFANGMYQLHSIDLRNLDGYKLHQWGYFKNWMKNDFMQIHEKCRDIINKKYIDTAIRFIKKYARTVRSDNVITLTHGDLTRPHIYVNSKSKKLIDLIDFYDVAVLREPCIDFSILDMKQFDILYDYYPDKKLLGRDKNDAIIRQQTYRLMKILWHLRDRGFAPEYYREHIVKKFSHRLLQTLADLGLMNI